MEFNLQWQTLKTGGNPITGRDRDYLIKRKYEWKNNKIRNLAYCHFSLKMLK
jgi:hypothetical protein